MPKRLFLAVLLASLAAARPLPAADLPLHQERQAAFWRPLAQQGDTDAIFAMGLVYLGGVDILSGAYMINDIFEEFRPRFAETMRLMRLAAEKGHAEAMRILGRLYEKQYHPDFANAGTWLKRAAEAGNVRAQYDFGWLCQRELASGGKREAEYWYKRAARQGYRKAEVQLAHLLETPPPAPKPKKQPPTYSETWDGKDLRVIYINGILTDVPRFNQTLALLERLFHRDGYGEHITVEGVYNPGGNHFTDLPWATLHKLRGSRSEDDRRIVERLRRAAEKALASNLEVVLVAHSRGNLFIHEFLASHPTLARRVHVLSLGSPTRTIPATNITYLVEKRDPVARIGELTELGVAIPQSIIDKLKKDENSLPALKMLADHYQGRELPKRGKGKTVGFITPDPRKSPLAAVLSNFFGSMSAHDVITSYLYGPGLECFREALYSIAGLVLTPKSPLPPPPVEHFVETIRVDDGGKGLEGFWLQHVNGRPAGVYHVERGGTGFTMKRVVTLPGPWLPYRVIRDIRLAGDEWSFTIETGRGAVNYALVRQTPDIYAAIVNHNHNRWVRTGSPWADKPLPEDIGEFLESGDIIFRTPPETFAPDPDNPEPDPLAVLEDDRDGDVDDADDTGDTGDTGVPPPEPSEKTPTPATVPAKRPVAVNPRGIVGTWLCRVNDADAGAYRVRYDAKARKHSMEAVEQEEGARYGDFADIEYNGATWEFGAACAEGAARFSLKRENLDAYAGDVAVEGEAGEPTRWVRQK